VVVLTAMGMERVAVGPSPRSVLPPSSVPMTTTLIYKTARQQSHARARPRQIKSTQRHTVTSVNSGKVIASSL